MAKGKKASKVAPEKKVQKVYPIKTAYECENCDHKCESGLNYLNRMSIVKKGNGCVCKHG